MCPLNKDTILIWGRPPQKEFVEKDISRRRGLPESSLRRVSLMKKENEGTGKRSRRHGPTDVPQFYGSPHKVEKKHWGRGTRQSRPLVRRYAALHKQAGV